MIRQSPDNQIGQRFPPSSPEFPIIVGIIMDGNGRWAKERGLIRYVGHRAGVDNIRPILESSVEFGIKVLTVYAFSTENWSRPIEEVSGLMRLLGMTLRNWLQELHENGVQIRHSGRLTGISEELQKQILHAIEYTKHNDTIILNVAFNYGGRGEILDATRQIIRDGIDPDSLSEETFSRYLYTEGLPDPDLIIRNWWRLAPEQLPDLAGGLCRVLFNPDILADFRQGGAIPSAHRVQSS